MKKHAKRLISFLSAALILIQSLCILPASATDSDCSDLQFVSGRMYSTMPVAQMPDSIEVSCATNLAELLSGDNTVYDQNIAVTAEILAADIYTYARVGDEGCVESKEDYQNDTAIYTDWFHMDETEMIDLSQASYDTDPNDVTRFVISHKKVNNREIIVVAVEGTDVSYSQWYSNFDVGDDSSNYVGTHPEWLNHANHKGFDVTYRRALASIQDYISEHVSPSAKKTILITGHSRGAAIANLLGKYFDGQRDYKSFTYTFAAPAVTTESDTTADTVFNIINEDDIVPYVPLSSWGFHRYGTDVTRNVADLSALWKSLTGTDYPACNGSEIETLASAVTADRSGIYTFSDESASASSKTYKTVADAQAQIEKNTKGLISLGFEETYFRFEVTEKDPTATKPYTISAYICPAFMTQYLANMIQNLTTSGSDYMSTVMAFMSSVVNYGINPPKTYSKVVEFMIQKFPDGNLLSAHCWYGYYVAVLNRDPIEKTDYTGTVTASASILADYASENTVILPSIPDQMSYGTPVTEASELSGLSVRNGKLRVSGSDAITVGSSYTVTIPVTGGPFATYNDFTITVTLTGEACRHTMMLIRNAETATTSSEGYTGDTYCAICGRKLSAGSVIPELTVSYAITAAQPEHGTLVLSAQQAAAGDSVRITVTPDSGFVLKSISAADDSGAECSLAAVSEGSVYSFVMPAGDVTVTAVFEPESTTVNPFADVPEGSYYYDAVLWAAANGIASGKDTTHFVPDAVCTRAEAVTFLWRAAGCPAAEITDRFSDVSADSYYAEAVSWAVAQGITVGTSDTTFSPNSTVTRAQAVTFLWRAYGAEPAGAEAAAFTDVLPSDYFYDAVSWAVARGITTGTDSTSFTPGGNCRRCDLVTFLYRCSEM